MENKKVKVSKDVKIALDLFFTDSFNTKEELLRNHMTHENGKGSWLSCYKPLANLTLLEVAQIVSNDYEEISPLVLEILEIINKIDNSFDSNFHYYDGYKAGLETALEIIEKHEQKENKND